MTTSLDPGLPAHPLPGGDDVSGAQIPTAAADPSRPGALSRIGPLVQGRNFTAVRSLTDLLVLAGASGAALLTTTGGSAPMAGAFVLISLVIAAARPGPDQRPLGSALDTATHVVGMLSLAAVAVLAGAAVCHLDRPVDLAVRLWLAGSIAMACARVGLLLVRRRALASEDLAVPTLILGAGAVGERIAQRLSEDHRYGLRPIGFLDAHPRIAPVSEDPATLPVLGSADELPDAVRATGARHVILAFTAEPDSELLEHVKACERLGVGVSLVPRLYESITVRSTLDHIGGMPLVGVRQVDPRGWQFVIKHALGQLLAALTLLCLAPVWALLAGVIAVSSHGSALVRRRRIGRDSREFEMLTFRTTRVTHGEVRPTAIGRVLRATGLHCVPQLWNVVRGDMALVGPRPEPPELADRLAGELSGYEERHRVKSGITGWAQVNGFNGRSAAADRVEMDNFYVQNWTLRLDFRILAMTAISLFRARGA